MNWLRQHRVLLFILLATVLIRLPNLNRPLSKHHEFNTAVTLTNAISWQQAGGGAKFSFTPLMNYQGYANKLWEEGPHIDSNHNHVYISAGAGIFLLPYVVLKLFHLPFTPLWLQLLNIIISLISLVLLYELLFKITQQKQTALLATAVFGFLPAVLWYAGNGYVNTVIMLPLVILISGIWHQLEFDIDSNKSKHLLKLFILTILLIYFDWYGVFLVGMLSLWAIARSFKQRAYIPVAITGILSVAIGVFLVLWQYAHYFGWDNVMQYWVARFTDRSTDTSRFSFGAMCVMIIKNLLTGYLPLLLLLPLLLFREKHIPNSKPAWPLWALISIIPYNGLFFNWSAEHEFAWLAFAIVGVMVVAVYVLPNIQSTLALTLIVVTVLLSIATYYFINRPGSKSWKGDDYAAQMQLGQWIHSNVDPGIPLFSNVANDRVVEYYSHRTFNSVADVNKAKQVCLKYNLPRATWLEIENNQVVRQVLILK